MSDSISYPPSAHYIPPYYPPPQAQPHAHLLAPPVRMEQVQRRRPKYTRSKTGCLTCRIKKIKCDETKPNCVRCVHGQRECTWPDGVPQRKKSTSKRVETVDGRPSTAGSSGLSEGSTPPTRDSTPPIKRENQELGLPPLLSKRHSDPFLHMPPPLPPTLDTGYRSHSSSLQNSSPHYSTLPVHPQSNALPVIPEMPLSYHTMPPVDRYASTPHSYIPASQMVASRPPQGHSYRLADNSQPQSMGHWHHSSHADSVDPYYSTIGDRNLMGQTPLDNHHSRYP
ncbi:hypothetical protein HETIRDRAFT_410078 [Heterobasidion irregulare TC 32-1]|uniref:Zn(2)-C6 fungal-type domain-containing protein n=1 Tax=Heterobasidion irregulare (strain TC 32-1) TaxID=747525 RepID=W4K524_HETIT|nr:uncharacterized protein HETIRDRAFT_410078 [Heterobasidion irregulare TC 32-1]ETW80839.1 hypothetical protein HETIRDRAFT_410078 [Heterobasidion irregulare TC 32-1]